MSGFRSLFLRFLSFLWPNYLRNLKLTDYRAGLKRQRIRHARRVRPARGDDRQRRRPAAPFWSPVFLRSQIRVDCDSLAAGVNLEFFVDPPGVSADGRHSHVHRISDVFVGVTLGE